MCHLQNINACHVRSNIRKQLMGLALIQGGISMNHQNRNEFKHAEFGCHVCDQELIMKMCFICRQNRIQKLGKLISASLPVLATGHKKVTRSPSPL